MSADLAMQLIERYLEVSTRLAKQLAQDLGVTDLFLALRRKEIPRAGTFGGTGEYLFHGIGCTIDNGSIRVNFDYYADGRFDAFDAWRLQNFALGNPDLVDRRFDTSRANIERELQLLAAAGTIESIDGTNLYRLAAHT